MKASTKQRIFWIVVTLLIAGIIYFLSSQQTNASEDVRDVLAKFLSIEQEDKATRASNQGIIFGLGLGKLAYAFLFVLFGLSLYFVFDHLRHKVLLTIISSYVYAILDEYHQALSGGYGQWQDTLIDLIGIIIGILIAELSVILLRAIRKRFSQVERRYVWVFDVCSLAAVLHYAIFRFLQSTMFVFFYSDRYKTITMLLLIVFGGTRWIFFVLRKYWEDEDHRRQSFLLLRCILSLTLAVPFVLVGFLHDYKILIFLPICCICLYDMDAEKVLRAFLITMGTVLAATLLCCLSGTLRNLVWAGTKGPICSFGIINTTDFGSYVSFYLIILWCGMRTRKWYNSVFYGLLCAGLSYLTWYVTDSRTVQYTCGLTLFFVLWDCLQENLLNRFKVTRAVGKGLNWLSTIAFPLVGASILFLTIRFAAGDPWALQLERTQLSGRLGTILNPFQKYGIHAFGSTITMHGNGATLIPLSHWTTGYTYLDVAYAMLAIRYGWVITAVVAGLWVWMTVKALKNGYNRIAFALVIMAFHGISEARILDVNYNILFIMPFCAMKKRKQSVPVKMEWFPFFTGIAVTGGLYLILPKLLSWLRSFFYLKGWNSGRAALSSFIVSFVLVFVIWLFWKNLSLLWKKRKKYNLIAAAGVLSLLISGFLVMNGTIEEGRKVQANKIANEEPVIRQIQEAATLPVYAAELEELYKREIGGFQDHIFSTEEILRDPKGTILVDGKTEVFGIKASNGGQYTQISEGTGLYSFDQNVIESLTNAGYTWTPYYSGVRSVNLNDTAIFNGRKKNDVVTGPATIITSNSEIDHGGGRYEVTFTLMANLESISSETKVGDLIVYSEAGEVVLIRKELFVSDFNTDGTCVQTLPYFGRRPKVSYGVEIEDKVSLTIEDISWKRIL